MSEMMRFRTPTNCHNGHFRWYYYEVSFGRILGHRWGPQSCTCPTHGLSEGFAPIGPDQRSTEILDRKGRKIWEGDILQRFPMSKYPHSWEVKFSTDEGFGLPESISPDVAVIGNGYEGETFP